MIFVIQDDGVGMSCEKLEKITLQLKGQKSDDGSSFALVNIHKRIQVYYGEKYGLDIQSQINQGTIVKVFIPIQGIIEEA